MRVDEARLALSRYSLDDPRIMGSLPASARNENLLVEDASGERYVLRRYKRNPSRPRIALQIRFQQHLFQRGVPTSRVIPVRPGKLILAVGDNLWALFSYVPGAAHEHGNAAQVGESARWLARFHTASQDFESDDVPDDTIPDVRRWWLDGKAELLRLRLMFDGRGVGSELAVLERWQSQLVSEWPLAELDALPNNWVHGDYQVRNMVFVSDRLAGLFDFDVAHRGFRVEDLALGLFSFGRERPGSDLIDAARAAIFPNEYRRGVDMTEGEIRALPMMTVAIQARNSARYALRQVGGEDSAGALSAHVRRMVALTGQAALIKSLCDHAL